MRFSRVGPTSCASTPGRPDGCAGGGPGRTSLRRRSLEFRWRWQWTNLGRYYTPMIDVTRALPRSDDRRFADSRRRGRGGRSGTAGESSSLVRGQRMEWLPGIEERPPPGPRRLWGRRRTGGDRCLQHRARGGNRHAPSGFQWNSVHDCGAGRGESVTCALLRGFPACPAPIGRGECAEPLSRRSPAAMSMRGSVPQEAAAVSVRARAGRSRSATGGKRSRGRARRPRRLGGRRAGWVRPRCSPRSSAR